MLLRSMTKHLKNQNWFAVALDFAIVVLGILIAFQITRWTDERQRQNNERQYFVRLHGEVELLIAERSRYDQNRPRFSRALREVVDLLRSPSDDTPITQLQCDAISGSSHTTVPPADLPTIRALLSSGQLDQIDSDGVRQAILIYTQQAERARDLIVTVSDNNEDLARVFPSLITVSYGPGPEVLDGVWLNPVCDTPAMRSNKAFLNALGINGYQYEVYTSRAVLPVSRELEVLHQTLDQALGISHSTPEPK